MKNRSYVICRECGEEHYSEEVESVDYYEGDRGQDVLVYICPVKLIQTESNVYRGR